MNIKKTIATIGTTAALAVGSQVQIPPAPISVQEWRATVDMYNHEVKMLGGKAKVEGFTGDIKQVNDVIRQRPPETPEYGAKREAMLKKTEKRTLTTIVKNLAYIPAVLLGLSPVSYLVLAIFMVIDTVLGVARVYIIHGGEHIRSYRLTAGIISKLSIIAVPLLVAWGGRGSGIDLTEIARATLGVLVLAELYSILGSIYAIRLRKDVHEFDAVSWVLERVQLVIERILRGENTNRCPSPDAIAFKKKGKLTDDK
jgi:hypothetical protein